MLSFGRHLILKKLLKEEFSGSLIKLTLDELHQITKIIFILGGLMDESIFGKTARESNHFKRT